MKDSYFVVKGKDCKRFYTTEAHILAQARKAVESCRESGKYTGETVKVYHAFITPYTLIFQEKI